MKDDQLKFQAEVHTVLTDLKSQIVAQSKLFEVNPKSSGLSNLGKSDIVLPGETSHMS